MLGQERKKSNVPIWIGVTLIAGLLGLAGGLGLASAVLDYSEDSGPAPASDDSQAIVSQLRAEVEDLQSDLEEMDSVSKALAEQLAWATQSKRELEIQFTQAEAQASSALEALAQKEPELKLESEVLTSAEAQISGLEERIESLLSQGAEGQGSLEIVREMSETVEKHRLLIVEMRKEPPDTREETAVYWKNIKTVASRADPVLTYPADRVILKIDNYFDWIDRSPNPAIADDEYADEYFDWLADRRFSGAEAFEDATESFTRDALLAVINQLDTVVSRLN